MTDAPQVDDGPRLRSGERILVADRESRLLRGLADGAVCAMAMAVGVAFHAFVIAGASGGGADSGGVGILLTIALTLAPIFLFLGTRPLARVWLTDQRILVGPDPDDLQSAELRQVTHTRIWLATLFIRLRDGTTLSVGNMRSLHAIEAGINARKQA